MRNPTNRFVSGQPGPRCQDCRLRHEVCLCAMLPTLATRTRLILILHALEDQKTTNTGRLAARCLPNSRIVVRGDRDRPLPTTSAGGAAEWDDGGQPVLLYPDEHARPIAAWRDHPRPITLIVPDGTWRQASRVRRRVAGLDTIPCAIVTPQAPSTYILRRTNQAGRLATIEAIAWALGELEGPATREALLDIFRQMVDRTLSTKGATRQSPAGTPRR